MELRQKTSWFIVSRVLTLALALTVLPACQASAGHRWARTDTPPGSEPTRRFALRPMIQSLPTRTFYPSGYAGVTYPPLGQGNRTAIRAARRPIYPAWPGSAAPLNVQP